MYSACVLKTLIHQFYLSVKIISLSVNPLVRVCQDLSTDQHQRIAVSLCKIFNALWL